MAVLTFFILTQLALLWFFETVSASYFPSIWVKIAEVCSVILLYLLLVCITFKRRDGQLSTGQNTQSNDALLIAYASQTGVAEELAHRTAKALETGGRAVRLIDFSALTMSLVENTKQALFIASTTGEGSPPDTANLFASEKMKSRAELSGLQYAVLALGDAQYRDFCAFGRHIDTWLEDSGAKAFFNRIDVNCANEKMVSQWFERITDLGAVHHETATPSFNTWKLTRRHLLNPGSNNPPVFHLCLKPMDKLPEWRAGDIAVISPQNDPALVETLLTKLRFNGNELVTLRNSSMALSEALSQMILPVSDTLFQYSADPQVLVDSLSPLTTREYSIASLPSSGQLDLVVRQMRHADGRLGAGSGWLTKFAPLQGGVNIRLRTNSNFHGHGSSRPMILIGAGSGIAGLRAHMKERIAANQHRNWLIFGERDEQVDYLFRDEIDEWQKAGTLERLDLCFMKDGVQQKVQDVLRDKKAQLQCWLDDGATLYISGSRAHIGAGMDDTMTCLYGDGTIQRLTANNRYKKDVY